jgi:serine/threonine protein kinase
MRVDSVATFVSALRDHGIMPPSQVEELSSSLQERFSDPRSLAKELVKRGWLTAYQAVQVLHGRGPNLVLGPYLILENLGRGAMGQVYKAQHRLMNRIVAIKVIHKGVACHPDALNRFLREVRASARMSHPNIILAHDAAQIGETHLLVMEYVEGTDLGRLVQQRGPLPVPQACEYIRQAALGLQHAHERGLVHRDIKPSNLLLTAKNAVVKILDLGIARLDETPPETTKPAAEEPGDTCPSNRSGSDLTQSGTVIGTPDYIAPEQAADPRQADTRSDIYGLGCTFYFLLTGRPPFPEGSQSEKLLCQQRLEPPPAECLRPDLPAGVVTALRTMMAKRQVDRYQSPALVVEALAPFAAPGHPDDDLLITLEDEAFEGVDPAQATIVLVRGSAAPTAPSDLKRARLVGRVQQRLRSTRPRVALGLVTLVLLVGISYLLLTLAAKPLPDGRIGVQLPRHDGLVSGVAFSPDGNLIVSGGGDNVVHVWDAWTHVERAVLAGHRDSIYAVAFAPDSRHVFSGSGDHTIRKWDIRSGHEICRFEGHSWYVHSLAVSGDGERILSGGADKTLRLWDVATGKELKRLTGHAGPVLSVALSADGLTAVSSDQDGEVRLWNVAAGCGVGRFEGHGNAVWGVALAPDGQQVVSGGEDQTIRLWDVQTRKELCRFGQHTAAILSVAFSPDGRRVLSGEADGTVRLWDVQTRRELQRFDGHTDAVRCVGFAADGLRAVSGSRDQTVRLWALPE